MSSVQMHLALTHVPVILSLVGLVMLIVSSLIKNSTLTKTSYVIILIAGVTALPVFFTGESTEEAVEHVAGVSEDIIERHEEVAKLAMISIAAAGLLALAALLSVRWLVAARILKVVVLLLAIASGGLMAQTAHLGGQIRHTEIRSGAATMNESKAEEGNENASQAEGIQEGVHEPHVTATAKVPAVLQLNNGAKWKTDEATRKNVAGMVKVINESSNTGEKNKAQLAKQLQLRIDSLVQQCSMQGPDHDALHLWLEQVLHDLKEVKEEDDGEYKQSYVALKKDVERFNAFFE